MDRTAPERDFARWRASGDSVALGRVFDAVAWDLLVVAGHVAGRGDAEDLIQGAFLEAIEHAGRWDQQRPLRPWLIGIVVRLARRERERRQRQRPDPERLARPAPLPPDQQAASEEVAQALEEALRGLPPSYRPTLAMRLVHGLTPTEIAHTLGEPIATVKSRLQRGLGMLRRNLPVGVHAGIAGAALPPSLAAVRGTVVQAAARVVPAAAPAAVAVGAGTGIGVMMVMQKTTVCVAGVLALGGALALSQWSWEPSPSRSTAAPDPHASGQLAASATAEGAAPLPGGADRRTIDAVADSVEPASTDGLWQGRVVDEAGQGLSDVTVYLALPGASGFDRESAFLVRLDHQAGALHRPAQGVVEVRTGADGAFAFDAATDDVPRVLVAWSPDRGAQFVDLEGGVAWPMEIVLVQGQRLGGVVRSGVDRALLPDATVSVYPERSGMPIAFLETDAQGRFGTVPLRPGKYRLRVKADGHADTGADAVAGDLALDVEVPGIPILDALLVDASGVPWTAAQVAARLGPGAAVKWTLTEEPADRWTTVRVGQMSRGDNNYVRFDADEGRIRSSIEDAAATLLTAWRNGAKLGEARVDDFGASRVAIELAAPPRVTLDIAVRFDPPPPIPPDVHGRVTDPVGWFLPQDALAEAASTHGALTFSVPASFQTRACGVLVQAVGYADHFSLVEVPAQGGAWGEITLHQARRLAGRVVGPDGRAPATILIAIVGSDGAPVMPQNRAYGDGRDDGSFAFASVPREALRLMVIADGCAPAGLDIAAGGDQEIEIELDAGEPRPVMVPGHHGAHLRILDAAGQPLLDDRITGVMRYGRLSILLGSTAVTMEAYHLATGDVLGRAPIPAHGPVVIED